MEPIEPEMTFAELEEHDPEFAELLTVVLLVAAGPTNSLVHRELGRSLGVEGSEEFLRKCYDAGLVHVFWTADRHLATIMVWDKDDDRYQALGPSVREPWIFHMTEDGWQIVNTDKPGQP